MILEIQISLNNKCTYTKLIYFNKTLIFETCKKVFHLKVWNIGLINRILKCWVWYCSVFEDRLICLEILFKN